nr:gamma-glutamyl hydrolase-like [Osmia lignaria]
MSLKVLICIVFSLVMLHFTIVATFRVHPTAVNNRPIIGVLTQELSTYMKRVYSNKYNSYIAASYVNFLEGAGARVVPIWIGKSKSYYENILSNINGVLLPGGGANFNRSNGYADAGDYIYKIAKRMNQNGEYFPILGVCLGIELLTYLVARRTEHRKLCNSYDQSLPLEFQPGYENSRLFKDASTNIIDILENDNVTSNFHHYCITEKALKTVHIYDQFRVLSLNSDLDGLRYISSLEHVTFPFYGLQFHPEKNLYEWIIGKIPHGNHPTKAAVYFAEFFVSEARKSNHKFPSKKVEALSLIYNYPVTYTGLKNSSFVQCYLFKDKDNSN